MHLLLAKNQGSYSISGVRSGEGEGSVEQTELDCPAGSTEVHSSCISLPELLLVNDIVFAVYKSVNDTHGGG